MSKIVYKPHCEKCGALIEEKIQYRRIVIELPNHVFYRYAPEYYEFDPYKCKNCGAVFDSAEVPLPEEDLQFIDK